MFKTALALLIALTLACLSREAAAQKRRAQVLCANGDVVNVRGRCKPAETKLTMTALQGNQGAAGEQGPQGAQGPGGAAGPTGAAGMDAAWGDGSGGDFTLLTSSYTFVEDNPQYQNVTIPAGTTLHVPSGTIIRCKGTFTNAGTIDVLQPAQSSTRKNQNDASADSAITLPLAGIALAPAGLGELGEGAVARAGGQEAAGLGSSMEMYRSITRPPVVAGGSGGPGRGTGGRGGSGGGGLAIYCEGAIVNTGQISLPGAPGVDSSGGGGGGVLILASRTGVTSTGTNSIDVSGGSGTDAANSTGACGGGGGGLVHVLAPTIDVPETAAALAGGAGGAGGGAGTISGSWRAGGSGGGGSVGDGGSGGGIDADGSAAPAGGGTNGVLLKRLVENPAGLL